MIKFHLWKSETVKNLFSKQTLAVACINLGMLSYGVSLAYPGVLFNQLDHNYNESLTNKVTANNVIKKISPADASFIASIFAIGSVCGCLVTLALEQSLGNRITLMLMALADVTGWFVIAISTAPYMFMIGRFLCGFASGAQPSTINSYIAEISTPKLRGTFHQIPSLSISIGVLCIFLCGLAFPWDMLAFVSSLIPVLLMICLTLMPDTPYFNIQNRRFDDALNSLRWLRPWNNDNNKELEDIRHGLKSLDNEDGAKVNIIEAIRLLFVDPTCYKPFISLITLFVLQNLSGNYAVTAYASSIYQKSGVILDQTYATILSGSFKLMASIVSLPLTFCLPRKTLLYYSCGMCAISAYVLALHLSFISYSPSWLPIVAITIFLSSFSLAFQAMPFLYIGELYPRNVCQHYGNITAIFNFIFFFVTLKIHPYLEKDLGPDVPYWIYGTICLITIVHIGYSIPETKGLTLSQIQNLYKNNNLSNDTKQTRNKAETELNEFGS